MSELRKSAVSWVERDGLVLVAWNDRFNGWTMPGGMVEPGETLEQAQARELLEETGLQTVDAQLVFRAELKLPPPKQDRSSDVHFFRVHAIGIPRAESDSRPITWLSFEELCRVSPFKEFYIAAHRSRYLVCVGCNQAQPLNERGYCEPCAKFVSALAESSAFGNLPPRVGDEPLFPKK